MAARTPITVNNRRTNERWELVVKPVLTCLTFLNFLQSCNYYGFIPKFLNFKLSNSRLRSSMMYTKCRRRLLSVETANKKEHIQRLQEKLMASLQDLRSCFSWFDYNHLVSFVHSHQGRSQWGGWGAERPPQETICRKILLSCRKS